MALSVWIYGTPNSYWAEYMASFGIIRIWSLLACTCESSYCEFLHTYFRKRRHKDRKGKYIWRTHIYNQQKKKGDDGHRVMTLAH